MPRRLSGAASRPFALALGLMFKLPFVTWKGCVVRVQGLHDSGFVLESLGGGGKFLKKRQLTGLWPFMAGKVSLQSLAWDITH